MDKKKPEEQKKGIVVPDFKPVSEGFIEVRVIGTERYMQQRFSEKAKKQMQAAQEEGDIERKMTKRKPRPPKDFRAEWEGCFHRSAEGWIGIPTMAFKGAMVRAAFAQGMDMTAAKVCFQVLKDGEDQAEGTGLVRIEGDVTPYEKTGVMPGRNKGGSMDLRCRPYWNEWSAVVRIRYNANVMNAKHILHLLDHAGSWVGIGEGRAGSKFSVGLDFGFFRLETQADLRKRTGPKRKRKAGA